MVPRRAMLHMLHVIWSATAPSLALAQEKEPHELSYEKLVQERQATLQRHASLKDQRHEQAILLRFRESLGDSWPKRKHLPEWQRQQEWVDRNTVGESLPCTSLRTNANQGSHDTPMEFYWHAVGCAEKRVSRINLRRGHLAFPKKLRGRLDASLPILGELPALKDLDFSNHTKNTLRGHLPERFGGSSLFPELRMATFAGARLDGTLPEVLPGKLRWIDLGSCRGISGTIPPWESHAPLLETVVLSSNSLSGTVPTSFFSMPSLANLLLDGNDLTGTLGTTANYMGTLVLGQPRFFALSLRNNALSGTLPAAIFSRMPALSSLAIDGPRMSIATPLPKHLGNQTGNFTLHHSIRYEFSTALPPHHSYIYHGAAQKEWPLQHNEVRR